MTGVFQLYGETMTLYGEEMVLYATPPVASGGPLPWLRRRRR